MHLLKELLARIENIDLSRYSEPENEVPCDWRVIGTLPEYHRRMYVVKCLVEEETATESLAINRAIEQEHIDQDEAIRLLDLANRKHKIINDLFSYDVLKHFVKIRGLLEFDMHIFKDWQIAILPQEKEKAPKVPNTAALN